jgi:hypothetical protein
MRIARELTGAEEVEYESLECVACMGSFDEFKECYANTRSTHKTWFALICGFQARNPPIIRWLLDDIKVDANVYDITSGKHVIHFAIDVAISRADDYGMIPMLELLLKRGARVSVNAPNPENRGIIPLVRLFSFYKKFKKTSTDHTLYRIAFILLRYGASAYENPHFYPQWLRELAFKMQVARKRSQTAAVIFMGIRKFRQTILNRHPRDSIDALAKVIWDTRLILL